jgi:hypothetical protein
MSTGPSHHSIAMAPDGTALAVWEQGNKILSNRFAPR